MVDAPGFVVVDAGQGSLSLPLPSIEPPGHAWFDGQTITLPPSYTDPGGISQAAVLVDPGGDVLPIGHFSLSWPLPSSGPPSQTNDDGHGSALPVPTLNHNPGGTEQTVAPGALVVPGGQGVHFDKATGREIDENESAAHGAHPTAVAPPPLFLPPPPLLPFLPPCATFAAASASAVTVLALPARAVPGGQEQRPLTLNSAPAAHARHAPVALLPLAAQLTQPMSARVQDLLLLLVLLCAVATVVSVFVLLFVVC